MISKIDIDSDLYKQELKKTIQFTKDVNAKFGFVKNPDEEINESVSMGLTRNQMVYGKRFCPCFMVIGENEEQRERADNRVCPCRPAIEEEIPQNGHCHCGIFCTPEYASSHKKEEISKEPTHSKGFSKDECEIILKKEQLCGSELESLLEARELGFVDFSLVDVREWMEWQQLRIAGTDALVPTTSFYESLLAIEDKKESPIVLYCLTGSRSNYCMSILKGQLGYKKVSNLTDGIVAYFGAKESGE